MISQIINNKGFMIVDNKNSIVKQDVNFLEHPLWSPDRRDKRYIYKIEVENGMYIYEASPNNIPDDTDALFLYFFLFVAQQTSDRTIRLSFYKILKELDYPINKQNYERLHKSLKRWQKVSVNFEGCFFKKEKIKKDKKPAKTITYIDKGFHILDYKIKTEKKDNKTKSVSYEIIINQEFFNAIEESAFIKYIDLKTMIKLKSPLAKRLNEYLAKQFIGRDTYIIGHEKLFGKIRLILPKYPSDIKRKLESMKSAINKINEVLIKDKYSMSYEERPNKKGLKPKTVFMITFKRDTLKDKNKEFLDSEQKDKELNEYLKKYFCLSNQDLSESLKKYDKEYIIEKAKYIKKEKEDKAKTSHPIRDIRTYFLACLKQNWNIGESQFDTEKKEKEEKIKKREAEKQRQEYLKERYKKFRLKEIEKHKSSLSDDELKKIELSILEKVKKEHPNGYGIKTFVRLDLEKYLEKKAGVPNFKKWEKINNVGVPTITNNI